jgi:hypothetical protein
VPLMIAHDDEGSAPPRRKADDCSEGG